MSAKASTSKEAVKSNTILTRNKSNLMKRQLRNKDESVRRISEITQMLLSPSKDKTQKSPQKGKKVKSPKIKGRQKAEESSPKKTQKKTKVKKTLLKPKYDLKAIGRKRKMAQPEKAGPNPPKLPKRPVSPTISELIRLTEDEDLDDEDLMEILTAESPVWWEDPPEPIFDEDPISNIRSKLVEEQNPDFERQKLDSESPTRVQNEGTQATDIKIPENKQLDPRFMNKRTKLENLLGNIKNKTTKTENKPLIEKVPEKNHKMKDIKTEDNLKVKDLTHAVIEQEQKEEINPVTRTEVKTEKDEENIKIDVKDEEQQEIGSKRSKTSSTSTDEDPFLALRNEDLLNDLQNMNIPIENDDCSIVNDQNTEEIKPDINYDEVTSKRNLSNDESQKIIKKEDTKDAFSTDDKSSENSNEKNLVFLDKANNNNNNTSIGNDVIEDASDSKDTCKINTMPEEKCLENTKTTFNITSIEKSSSSPISFHSIETDATSISNIDAISDTNIQFIEDCGSYKTCDTTDNEETDSIKSDKNIENESEGSKSESKPKSKNIIKEHLRAVYKTFTSNITEKDESKTNQNTVIKDKTLNDLDSTSSLDSFYKKCKNGNQKSKQKSEKGKEINTEDRSDIKLDSSTENFKENKSECPKCSNHTDNDKDNTKNIVPIEKSAKYCLKCSSIFETETCTYCTKKEKLNSKNYQCKCNTIQT